MKANDYIKSLSVLAGGSVFAQLIPLLFSFILARQYDSQQIALFGTFMAIASPLSSVFCLRYEHALMLPESDTDAYSLFRAAAQSGIFFSFLSLLSLAASFIMRVQIDYVIVCMALVFYSITGALSQSALFWYQRKKKFKKIAWLRTIQVSAVAFFSVCMGWVQISYGLILGYLTGSVFIFLILKFSADLPLSVYSQWPQKKLLYAYKDFPLYNLFPALLNALTVSIPVFAVQYRFNSVEAGNFILARQIMLAFSSAGALVLAQWYFQRSAELFRLSLPQLPEFFRVFITGFLPAFVLLLLLFFFGRELFVLMYGTKWSLSGDCSWVLSISVLCHVSVFPLMSALSILGKIKYTSLWQVLYFMLTASLLFFSFNTLNQFVGILAGIDTVCYALLFLMVFVHLRKSDLTIKR